MDTLLFSEDGDIKFDETKLGSVFKDLPKAKYSDAIKQMSYLAKGEWDAVAVTRLLQMDIPIPFAAPLWSDTKANEEYWPQVRKWAARQLGWETKEKNCSACGKHEGFTYDKTTSKVSCNACGVEKVK